jgi:iron complex outermembrane receptor protein
MTRADRPKPLRPRPLAQALLAVLMTSGACSAAVTAAADGADPNATPPDGDKSSAPQALESIVVSGEGHKEALQKASTPITVFSATKILDAGIQSTGDFVRLVPNMSYDTSFTIGNSFVVMRGIQQINNADAPIAIVVDGVPQNNQKEFKMDLFDIDQIEVLRGPQGALYGRNALGGAINITTKQPTDATEGYFQATLGDDGLRKVAAGISGPLIKDELFYRVALSGTQFDGSIRNSYTGLRVDSYKDHDLRAQLKWLPTSEQEFDLRVNSSLLWGGAIMDTAFPAGTPNDTNIWQTSISDTPGVSHRRIDSATLRYKRDFGKFVFTSITGYTYIFEDYFGDGDFCNPGCPEAMVPYGQNTQAQTLRVRQFSQELRLSSADDANVKWTAGVYALHTHRTLDSPGWLVIPPDPPSLWYESNEGNNNFAWAAFGQAQVPLGEKNQIALSLRYDSDLREQTDLLNPDQGHRTARFDAWQPKLTFTHFLSDTQQIYATAAKGFRSGGFNAPGLPEFLPEHLTSFEVGYKTSWLDNRLTVNSALFYEKDRDYQFFYVNEEQLQVISNLHRVDIKGLETEVNWLVRPGWQVFGSLGLLGSDIRDVGISASNFPIKSGNRAPRTEPYNAVLGSQWNFPLGERSAMFRFDVSRKGRRTWEADNVAIMNPVTLVNARFTYFGGDRWNLTAWTSNLFNHRYYGDFGSTTFTGLPVDIASPAQGRHFGIDYRYDF